MDFQYNLYTFIVLIGFIQAIFFAVILLIKKDRNIKANRFLSLFLFSLSFSVLSFALQVASEESPIPKILKITYPLLFCYGPFFFLYVKALIIPGFKMEKKNLLHFIFPVFCLVFFIIYISIDYAFSINPITTNPNAIAVSTEWVTWLIAIGHIAAYIIVIQVLVTQHNKNIKTTFSNIDKINLKWIRFFLNLFTICWIFVIIFNILDIFIIKKLFLNNFNPVFVTVFIFIFGFRGIMQPQIFSEENGLQPQDEKYKKSVLSDKKIAEYIKQLDTLMREDKLFIQPEITLPMLADKMGISRHELSQVINTGTNQNFYDFINSYRIDEVKKLLIDPKKKHLTFLAIALEAGFNSKATFNAVFKKNTGTTPSEYKNKNYITITP